MKIDSGKIRDFGVILEEILLSQQLVIEKLESLKTSLAKKIEDGNKMLAERLDAIILALKLASIHSTTPRCKNIRKNRQL